MRLQRGGLLIPAFWYDVFHMWLDRLPTRRSASGLGPIVNLRLTSAALAAYTSADTRLVRGIDNRVEVVDEIELEPIPEEGP